MLTTSFIQINYSCLLFNYDQQLRSMKTAKKTGKPIRLMAEEVEEYGLLDVFDEIFDFLDDEDAWLNPQGFQYSKEVKEIDVMDLLSQKPVMRPSSSSSTKTTILRKERSRSSSLGRLAAHQRLELHQQRAVETDEEEDTQVSNMHPIPLSMSSIERTKTFTRRRVMQLAAGGTITRQAAIKRTGTFKARSNGCLPAYPSEGSINDNDAQPTTGSQSNLLRSRDKYNNNFEFFRNEAGSSREDGLGSQDLDAQDVLNDNLEDVMNKTFTKDSPLSPTPDSKQSSRGFDHNTYRKSPASYRTFTRSDFNRNPSAYPALNQVFSVNGNSVSSQPNHAQPKIMPGKPALPAKPIALQSRQIVQPRSLSSSRYVFSLNNSFCRIIVQNSTIETNLFVFSCFFCIFCLDTDYPRTNI